MTPALRSTILSAVSLLTVGVVLAGCAGTAGSSSTTSPVGHHRTSPGDGTTGAARSPQPSAAGTTLQPVTVSVFYVGGDGALVARSASVDAHGDRIAEALALAAAAPAGSGLEPAIPADAFGSVSFDGVGAHGQFGVELTDPSVMDDRSSMAASRSRLAVRAAVCTVQNGIGAPVVFYSRGKPVDRLFGQPLRDGVVRDGHCPR